ncbi:MAG TPA: nucleotidyltransferase family protein [Labilithrix sp.]|jgi:CTP:molybdopterin cytidylyltransferase MocA
MSVVCAVLAAGASRRLGRPKQLVAMDGRPLVRHVVERVRSQAFSALAVVVGAHAREVEAALDGARVAIVANDAWDEGVGSSIRAAVKWARRERADALAIVLADQPRVDAAHLERLVDAWREGSPIAASAYGGTRGAPAVFDASTFDALASLEGDRGAARVVRAERRAAAVDWPEGAIDIDTPDDYASY